MRQCLGAQEALQFWLVKHIGRLPATAAYSHSIAAEQPLPFRVREARPFVGANGLHHLIHRFC